MCLLYEWESAAGTTARHGASASLLACFACFRFFSRPFPERRAETMTSLRRCVKCMFLDRLLVLLVFAVSVAESDVYTDVALAIELAATGSHQYIALFGNVLNCVPPISIKFASM